MEHALKEIPQGQEQEQELSAWKTTKNHALRIPGPSQTNQRGELMPIVKVLSITPKGDVLTIVTDSMYAIQGIIENL